MAGIFQRKNMWIAFYQEDGKQVRKSTKVHVKPTMRDGKVTARDLKKLAERVAGRWSWR